MALDNFRTQKIIWDRANKKIFETIEANSGDSNGRKLVVQIINQEATENLSGATLSLGWKSRNGAKGLDAFNIVDASKGIFEIYYTTEMLSNIGNLEASLILIDSTGRIESSTFTISVRPSTVDDESVESENSFTALTEALVKVNDFSTQLAKTETELTKKPDKNETGWATLNTFDEPTRAVIQGMEPGQINAVLGERNVQPINTTFFSQGKNIFNNDAVEVATILSSNGVTMVNADYSTSGFIPVNDGVTYTYSEIRSIAYYNASKAFLSYRMNASGQYSGATPEGARYIRVSVLTDNLTVAQIEIGAVKTDYEPFRYYIPQSYTEKHDFNPLDIPDSSIGYQKTSFVTLGKNLFNPVETVDGQYVAPATGYLYSNTSYFTTGWIEVGASENYVANKAIRFLVFYDAYKNHIGSQESIPSGTALATPANARYARFSCLNAYKTGLQFERGTVVTPYEPYGYKIPQLIKESDSDVVVDELLTHLPKDLYIASGRTIELYNNQVIWTGNLDNFHIQWESSIGKAFKRKWSFTANDETIGDYSLTLNVYDNNMKQVATDTTTVHVVDSVLINTHNVVTIGDSLSNNKPWLNELELLSNDKLINIGTRQGRHEGRSGVNANWYLGDNTYTFDTNYDNSYASTDGSENPFWNPTTSAFDFDYYKATYNKDPQAVQIFLGTNGIAVDPTENASNIKAIVDGIRASDTTIPIFVVNTLYRGSQNGIGKQASNDGYSAARGQWKLEEDRKVFNLMVRLDELLNDYTNVHFVPVALTHDSEYNFGQIETPVNPRSSVTEPQHKEATHPQTEGYLQMADIMFSTMAGTLN